MKVLGRNASGEIVTRVIEDEDLVGLVGRHASGVWWIPDETRANLKVENRVEAYDPEQRYRAYRLDVDISRSPVEVCAAATPEALGLAVCTIGREHFEAVGIGHPAVGVMDTLDRKWIVNPWNREGTS